MAILLPSRADVTSLIRIYTVLGAAVDAVAAVVNVRCNHSETRPAVLETEMVEYLSFGFLSADAVPLTASFGGVTLPDPIERIP